MAQGLNAESVKAEFLQHAGGEQGHADAIAARITQFNGEPDLNPDTTMKRSHSQYDHETDLIAMIKEYLVAGRIAIEAYLEIVR